MSGGSQSRRPSSPVSVRRPGHAERIALLSMHSCPLDQPGVGDSGGMNVSVRAVASRLAEMGLQVDLFTRASGPEQHGVDIDAGVRVIHLDAGPHEPLDKEDLPNYLWPFLCHLLRFEAEERSASGMDRPVYDVIHTHYWLSGWAGRLLHERLAVPLVHSFHTLGHVKNRALSKGEDPEPAIRLRGEERIVASADALIAPTMEEATDLIDLYNAQPERVRIVAPGVDTDRFRPGHPDASRKALGLEGKKVVLFVGRLQPLKRPDLAVRSMRALVDLRPDLADSLLLVIIGGASGRGGVTPDSLRALAASLGIDHNVEVREPVPHALLPDYYRAADVVIMPSTTESFGLVALEAQACGTPVVAADVDGLRTAVRGGTTGTLVSGDNPTAYAQAIERLLSVPSLRATMGAAGARYARGYDWRRSAAGLLAVYDDLVVPSDLRALSPTS
ncbi:MAG: D-inositol-3-phosphate glycosyltransferase [Actinomycetota bacterium]